MQVSQFAFQIIVLPDVAVIVKWCRFCQINEMNKISRDYFMEVTLFWWLVEVDLTTLY